MLETDGGASLESQVSSGNLDDYRGGTRSESRCTRLGIG